MNLPSSVWSVQNENLLRQCFAEGMSGSQIARRIGCGLSRNAIIGKLHRLGLTRASNPAPKRYAPPPKPPAQKAPKLKLIAEKPTAKAQIIEEAAPTPVLEAVPSPETLVALLDLQAHHCRWPFGEPDQGLFCGAQKAQDRPYCPGHARIAFQAPASPKRPSVWLPGQRTSKVSSAEIETVFRMARSA